MAKSNSSSRTTSGSPAPRGRDKEGRSNTPRKVTQARMEEAEIANLEETGKFPLQCDPFEPLSTAQHRYWNQLKSRSSVYVFGLGDAGCGKTYLATRYAIEQLSNKRVKKIYVTRPAKEVEGEEMGFLPGELGDKFEPYLTPLIEIFQECIAPGTLKYLRDMKVIEPVPMGYLRGRTLKDCIVLVDEAQNITPKQAKMVVTRLGSNAQMVLSGDISQMDIRGESGLQWLVNRMRHLPIVEVSEFTRADSVRSGFMVDVLEALEDKPAATTLALVQDEPLEAESA